MSFKKFVLVVQGEGRGHMTQALSMYDLLISKGHKVCAIILGSGGVRETPDFFKNKVTCPIINIQTPNFVTDKNNKGILLGQSIVSNFAKLKIFRASFKIIREVLDEHKPDAILNFYDLIMGLYYLINKPAIPVIGIGHQYMFLHPKFEFPKGQLANRWAIKFYTKLTATGASKYLALSFYPKKDKELRGKLVIVPPLLRSEVFQLHVTKQDYILVYLVNNGYVTDLVNWHKKNPECKIHCFTDINKLENIPQSDNLHFHMINDKEFLEMMANATGLASTAGFESVCEAMFLGKPVLMVPIEGHYEQFCNSRDAYIAGAGIYDDKFRIERLLNYSKSFEYHNQSFKSWANKAKNKIYQEICEVINN
jgi:uncharacterized protein (TIGR00661 family)